MVAKPNDGSKTNYYQIPTDKGYVDVDDIAEYLELHGFLFNILKSVFGCAIVTKTGNSRHSGTSQLRDANKMVHYANKYRDMIIKSDYKPNVEYDSEELETLAYENKKFAEYLSKTLDNNTINSIANGSHIIE